MMALDSVLLKIELAPGESKFSQANYKPSIIGILTPSSRAHSIASSISL
jgi:hypothetical protein